MATLRSFRSAARPETPRQRYQKFIRNLPLKSHLPECWDAISVMAHPAYTNRGLFKLHAPAANEDPGLLRITAKDGAELKIYPSGKGVYSFETCQDGVNIWEYYNPWTNPLSNKKSVNLFLKWAEQHVLPQDMNKFNKHLFWVGTIIRYRQDKRAEAGQTLGPNPYP